MLRPARGARQSAVLALFGERLDGTPGPEVLLVERAATLRSHPGQIAFPGGAVDPDDVDLADTALREAYEECGVVRDGVEVLGMLPRGARRVSGFDVTAVVGLVATAARGRAGRPARGRRRAPGARSPTWSTRRTG